jgi:hypothetical protein
MIPKGAGKALSENTRKVFSTKGGGALLFAKALGGRLG